ncbi:AHH domain-containing protein [Longimicrobium sp.]|uniref:AHH domain-containing protein n=1 Tax=Longimicrobium sp. TaxID=2029185 RepID=UPI003B3B3530
MKLGRKPPSVDADLLKAEQEYAAATKELAWEYSKIAVDVAGIVDPSPLLDAVSMGMSLMDGDLIGAGLSLVSMVPYAGDALAKTTKGARATRKILKLQKKIAALAAKVRTLKTAKASKGVSKAASKAVSKAAKKPASGPICVPCAKRAKTALTTKRGTLKPTKNRRQGPVHHIATNKNTVSKARGGPWTPRFKPLFDRAGMSMDDVANTVVVPGHKGPHPAAYHSAVYDRLTNAVRGKDGLAYRQALTEELQAIGREAATPGSLLNRLLTRK